MAVKLRKLFDDSEREFYSDVTGLDASKDGRTQQSFGEEVDINTIVRRFGLDGQMPVNPKMPSFGDFETVDDFHSAALVIRESQANFMALPARVRARFHNDPQELLEFIHDESNVPEAVKLGLIPEPVQAPVVAPTAPGGPS